ncbi:MAG: hypothetical protein L3J18_08500 [Candidatus Brocadia sp.]|nr:MAG: hypothetical protein L3J18_08500 [Candidatus Brocadia sp.]
MAEMPESEVQSDLHKNQQPEKRVFQTCLRNAQRQVRRKPERKYSTITMRRK